MRVDREDFVSEWELFLFDLLRFDSQRVESHLLAHVERVLQVLRSNGQVEFVAAQKAIGKQVVRAGKRQQLAEIGQLLRAAQTETEDMRSKGKRATR